MIEYTVAQEKRRFRQIVGSVMFILVLAGGWIWPLLGYFVPFCMLIGMGIGIFRGRKWCDWLCPRGSFFDIAIKPFSPKAQAPRVFKNNKFKISVLALMMLILVSNIISRWPNPYLVGKFFIIMLSVTTVIGIILGLIFHQRSWCFFCPVGSLAGWLGGSRKPLKIISELCNECQLCTKACPMQNSPLEQKRQEVLGSKEDACIKCDLCVRICPSQALVREGKK
ncbi:MAG: 4Fe-4S binding protein [Candidatus Omnitrophica bacterium]|nr:4Fe-4S binding protein [Candidatus Omnitrophota bacterium]